MFCSVSEIGCIQICKYLSVRINLTYMKSMVQLWYAMKMTYHNMKMALQIVNRVLTIYYQIYSYLLHLHFNSIAV